MTKKNMIIAQVIMFESPLQNIIEPSFQKTIVKKEEGPIKAWVILIVFISLIQMAYGQSKLVTIKGTVPGNTKGHNKIYCYGNGVKEDLSSELKGGAFELSIPFDKPVYIFFNTEYDLKTKHSYHSHLGF